VSLDPHWATWNADPARPELSVGVEEEVMLLHPESWSLAQAIDDVLPALSPGLASHVTPETHGSALELATGSHDSVRELCLELADLRACLAAELAGLGLRAAASGTHPFTEWRETRVSEGARYQLLYGSLRELARREPTFALHVHVGVSDSGRGVFLLNRLRAHLPLLLGLSANSPFWQGRDAGLASTRIPLFQVFPRVGIPRRFRDYDDYVEAIDLLIRCGAIPEPTFLWWDVRLQPRFGTVEVRIMDAQSRLSDTVALVALVQSIARLELEEGFAPSSLVNDGAVLDENRFLAARDGADAALVDPESESLVPLRRQLARLLVACRPHAVELGCATELDAVSGLARRGGAGRQRAVAGRPPALIRLVETLSGCFTEASWSAASPQSRYVTTSARATRSGGAFSWRAQPR
jgi:carboxylate-amine ligase